MKTKILTSFKNNRILVENFSSLFILQILNYIIPLVTFPYLVRVLGAEKFGLVQFAIAFVSYFALLIDFGFQFTATREISIKRDNKIALSEIFSSILIIKFIILLISTFLFLLITYSFNIFSANYKVYLLTYLMIIGQTFLPVWFFQGIEKMKYILIISLIIRILATILIFLLIKSQNDLLYLISINSLTYIMMGIVGILFIIFKIKVRIILPEIKVIKYYFNMSGYVFFSTVAINLYTISNTFILGLLTNNTIVGYFSIADKIRIALQATINPLSQALFPHQAKLFSESKEKAIEFIKKIIPLAAIPTFAFCTLLFIFAKDIIYLISGNIYSESVQILRIISYLPFIILLSNIGGIQIMLNLNYDKQFFLILIIASIINIVLSLFLIPYFSGSGTAIAMLITEIYVTSTIFIFLGKKEVKLIWWNAPNSFDLKGSSKNRVAR